MNKKIKTVLGIALTLCYAIGLIAMFTVNVSLGLSLWVISTLGGMGFLWYIRHKEQTAAQQTGTNSKTDANSKN